MYESELESTLYLLKLAAKIISDGFLSTSYSVDTKSDGSVVTTIDKKVDTFLRSELSKRFPNYAFLTEESADDLSRINAEFVWIIDPIDGTEEFVKHEYQFVTNVALCRNHEIVLAAIMEPISGEIYYAIKGEGAYKLVGDKLTRIYVSDKLDNLTCLTSPYHMYDEEKNYLEKYKHHFESISYSGAAYKACQIASGQADVSYRFSPYSKEWDTAAPQLLIEEAGGVFIDKKRVRITYNRKDVRNLDGFIMLNRIENYFE